MALVEQHLLERTLGVVQGYGTEAYVWVMTRKFLEVFSWWVLRKGFSDV